MVSWNSRDSSAVLNRKHCLKKAKCSEEIVKREPGFATKISTECTRSQARMKCIYHLTNSEAVGHELLKRHDSMDQIFFRAFQRASVWSKHDLLEEAERSKESREEDEKMTHGRRKHGNQRRSR
jgi:hypothetical protein